MTGSQGDNSSELGEGWPALDEELRPFGLRVGESMVWNGVTLERNEVLGPNWNYDVWAGAPYVVNVANREAGVFGIVIKGWWHGQGGPARFSEGKRLKACSPEEALVWAVARLLENVAHQGSLNG